MEPIMINAGVIEPLPGYLERVRQLCNEHRIVLIFDEVISGFRVNLGRCSSGYDGVVPNLATYGKAMAGGWPVSALAGDAGLMAKFGTGEVNHSGTFNSSVMAMAATVATLGVLLDEPPYPKVREHGLALMEGDSAKTRAALWRPAPSPGYALRRRFTSRSAMPRSPTTGPCKA